MSDRINRGSDSHNYADTTDDSTIFNKSDTRRRIVLNRVPFQKRIIGRNTQYDVFREVIRDE